MSETDKKLTNQENIKLESKYLSGQIFEELQDKNMISVSNESYELLKFFGTYQGYNRDSATSRKKAGLDKEYEFMVRLKIPAGRLTSQEYLAITDIAEKYANDSLKITTRETFQIHCVLKDNLHASIAQINKSLLTTLSGCGDVVRNVMISPAPINDIKHNKLKEDADKIADFCKPKTSAYEEIFDGSDKSNRDDDKLEPLYGKTYLPRKFKIGLIIPEDNSIEVFTHDLGFVLVFEGDEFKGYNVLIGGGMGMTHNKPETYPRLASEIAFIEPEGLLPAVEAVVKMHRDFGDRTNRKHARIKYVVEENGIDWTKKTFKEYFEKANLSNVQNKGGVKEPYQIKEYQVADNLGWHKHEPNNPNSLYYLGVPVETAGRIADFNGEDFYDEALNKNGQNFKYKSAFIKIAKEFKPTIILTADQNIIFCDIKERDKASIEKILRENNINLREDITNLNRYMLACVALPTCGKALADAERVKIPMQENIQNVMNELGLNDEKITVRIAGCPNGCSRPYVGDIGIVGRAPKMYKVFIGGDFESTRLNKEIFDKVPENDVHIALKPMFELFKDKRESLNEGFGDFCHRYGIKQIAEHAINVLESKKWLKYSGS